MRIVWPTGSCSPRNCLPGFLFSGTQYPQRVNNCPEDTVHHSKRVTAFLRYVAEGIPSLMLAGFGSAVDNA
jgi:hypothetical protein